MDAERTVPTNLAEGGTGTLDTHGADAPQAPTTPPELMAGYRRLRLLGAGGMGDVYLAEQQQLGRQVALKVLRPGATTGFVQRFLREAKAMAALTHPNIVAIHDAGEQDGFLFMALELVTGGDLAKTLKVRGPLPEVESLRLIIACCRGLEAIEAAGLIHRDIKPANIFLTRDGIPKIGDLGLARHADGEDRMTLTGHSWGTPAYMSPEQVRGEPDIDIRSDIYALAATLYCLLTGHPPFQGPTSYVITTAVLTQAAPDVRHENRLVKPATAAILRTALAKDRRQRHPTPAALRVDLERALEGLPLAFAACTDAPTAAAESATPAPPTALPSAGTTRPVDPFLVKCCAYGGGVLLVSLVVWSLSGETVVHRPTTTTATAAGAGPVAPSEPWMTREGRDDLGSWAEVQRDQFHLRFRWLPAGTFAMGSPTSEPGRSAVETLHDVTLTRARWMSESEISQGTWATLMGGDSGPQANVPVTRVSWFEIGDFLTRLREAGIPARLPTEAEWEHAARAGGEGPYGAATPDPREWLGQPDSAGPRLPDPATANRFGLLDMGGNVREWVADTWDGSHPYGNEAVTDPWNRFGSLQVVRGGMWSTAPSQARCAARAALDPQVRDAHVGFRIVIAP